MRPWRALVVLSLLPLPHPLFAAEVARPLHVWEVNFDDPAEAERWKRYSIVDPTAPLQWASEIDRGSGKRFLRVTASRNVGVESFVTLYRDFPPDFRPAVGNALVVDWDWKVLDTETSDWVALGLLAKNESIKYDYFISHTRYTKGWRVLHDPAGRWVSHRISIGDGTKPWVGVFLDFHDPVDQVVAIRKLRIEEWPAGSMPADPPFVGHRTPLPPEPFATTPLEALRHATAGVLEDLDGDGYPEIVAFDRGRYMHLYRNDGHGRFAEEVTEMAGLALPTFGTGALALDVDGDGDLDLVVPSEFDTPRFFENTATGRFKERPILGDEYRGFWYTAAAEDLDRDGRVDFVFAAPEGTTPPLLLLTNSGDWHFKPAALPQIRSMVDEGQLNFAATVGDLDGDDRPDVVLAREYLFRNHGKQLDMDSAAWKDQDHTKAEGVVFADFNGDGIVDILVLRDASEAVSSGGTRLLIGDGKGFFGDTTKDAHLPELRSAEVALAEDFNNDGNLDLYICQRDQPNYLLLNDGKGHFTDATEASGLVDDGDCDSAVAADLDGDGGMDVIIFRYSAAPRLLHNDLKRGHWVGIKLEARATPIGSKVQVIDADTGATIRTEWARSGRGFGSTGPAEIRFGLGDRTRGSVKVRFPGGATRQLEFTAADRTLFVSEGPSGLLGSAVSRLRELRLSAVTRFRRALGAHSSIMSWLALAAFTVGVLAITIRNLRPLAVIFLGAAGIVLFGLGRTPWRSAYGFPALVWLTGACAGAFLPLAMARLRTIAQPPRPIVDLESLVRHTRDFRHAGVETRLLLSIHGRTQNLFLGGTLHEAFYRELVERARRFDGEPRARLLELVTTAHAAFPDLSLAGELHRHIEVLTTRLRELPRLPVDGTALTRWRETTLPTLDKVNGLIPALLEDIDRRCTCDCLGVIEEARLAHADALSKDRVDVHVTCTPERLRPTVLITRTELLTVIENLFANAIVAMVSSTERAIIVTIAADDRQLRLRFQDSGPGIQPEQRGVIFQPDRVRRTDGKGYGLTRSKEILGSFGGSIEIEESGRGACFLVVLRKLSG